MLTYLPEGPTADDVTLADDEAGERGDDEEVAA